MWSELNQEAQTQRPCWPMTPVPEEVTFLFSLQENAIGDEGASALASALKVNTALTAL